MKKLGGRSTMADSTSPPQTAPSASATEISATRTGRAVIRSAVAAGVTTSANSSSVPTTWTAIVIVRARRTTNARPSARTGTPRASATAGSTEANTSGRARTASVPTTAELFGY
jgi:hypothetical protein